MPKLYIDGILSSIGQVVILVTDFQVAFVIAFQMFSAFLGNTFHWIIRNSLDVTEIFLDLFRNQTAPFGNNCSHHHCCLATRILIDICSNLTVVPKIMGPDG